MSSTYYSVEVRSTSTSVSCSPGAVAVGQSSKCTATVTDTDGGTPSTPMGPVSFESDGAGSFSAGQCTLSQTSPGVAACSVTYTPTAVGTGAHTVTAGYGGDLAHGESSGSKAVPVTARSTTTSVSCSLNPAAIGQATTCAATVTDTSSGTASTPTGTVGFASNGTGSFSAGHCTLSQTSPGVAGCSVIYTPGVSAQPAPTRTDPITATYGADPMHAGSSGTTAVTVRPTTKAACRNNGWQDYGFQSQAQCIQFLSAGGVGEPPPSKAECRNGGWRTLGFRNQGQCIQLVVPERPHV